LTNRGASNRLEFSQVVAAAGATMTKVIVTGAGGLIGSESVGYFAESGFEVIGIDNDLRAYFFGPGASTAARCHQLTRLYPHNFEWVRCDIRDADAIDRVFAASARELELIVHTAAQPSHDWAAGEPVTDFTVNANGTLNLLDATRRHNPGAAFVFCSTNKVYGDRPNSLPLVETDTRLELPPGHEFFNGIPETMSIDQCLHSLFGVSKAAADLLVQEYGRYFAMPTMCLRGGCLTGPHHAGAELHGFLAYLMKCTVIGRPYTIYGYGGKQVRDNIHSADFVRAIAAFCEKPRVGAVYNMGGGRKSNCSMLEAIAMCEDIANRALNWNLVSEARIGDHRWWISDLRSFTEHYPDWGITRGVREILEEIYRENADAWLEIDGAA
jgi:CDP-paratose 2-epimerase